MFLTTLVQSKNGCLDTYAELNGLFGVALKPIYTAPNSYA